MRETLTKLFGNPYQIHTRVNGREAIYDLAWVERLPQSNVCLHYIGNGGKVEQDVLPGVGILMMTPLS